MEHVDVILGHNIEFTGSMSRLPILAPECWNGRQLEGACQAGLTFGLVEGKSG